MRLRNDKNAKQKLSESNIVYFFDENLEKIDLNTIFNNNNPIYIEIGMGKGDFIINNAINNPNINYIGIEKYDTVLVKAINKAKKYNIKNLRIFSMDAELLNKIFPSHSVAKIYLNFSDPWPKKRHAKRRLTHPNFLKIYYELLMKNSQIEFKTDNDGLFKWTIDEILTNKPNNYKIIYKTTNLYNDLENNYNINNVASEYEKKFHSLGKNINKVIFEILNPEIDNVN